ncbi:thioredoxin family protein [Desertibacillus haloalkaliphilus]|uniref:thioredoxin family protein n=1 Tax=Desertibacillus haloalkaliphilus TaxID=1328930 RepID=UPI001C264ED6|nr:thioredoxin family protein [Desertibacillus haloalkaliphilus]MBU8905010.1 thioredoxin family protein [Desertibacillus haloalkaliphilus]
MKKIVIFLGVIIVLFAALAFVTNTKNEQRVEGNPFEKETLHSATINQLDDPIYENIILPDELIERLNAQESMTIYYYSPTCPACEQTSPIIVPMAEEMGLDMKLFNLLEFEGGWATFDITETPTVVRYENGQEVGRIGYVDASEYEQWFTQWE